MNTRDLTDKVRMRVVHLSYADTLGGAARASYRLHQGLRAAGQDSTMLVLRKVSDDPDVHTIKDGQSRLKRLYYRVGERIERQLSAARIRNRPARYAEPFSSDRTLYGSQLRATLPQTDIVNLHWIAQFVDYGSFFPAVSRQVPLVWRLPDMQALTGGCHYDDNCGRYSQGCGSCPQLGSTSSSDPSSTIWRRKQRVFDSLQPHHLHFVALCRWMAHELSRSPFLRKFPVTIIPNGLDVTETFRPRSKEHSRELFGIPQQAKVILFVAESVYNSRKGMWLLLESLARLRDMEDLVLLSIGQGLAAEPDWIKTINLGTIHHDGTLSHAYSAADLYVIPSIQDNLPNTVLESLACGTPAVGFNVGGIPDMIRPGLTGELVPVGDVEALSQTIRDLLHSPDYLHRLSLQSRAVAESEYGAELQAQRYLELYQQVIAEFQRENR